MEHISLIIFTICVQLAIGITVFAAIGRFLYKEKVFKNAIIVSATLAVIGMIFSLLHLGHPMKAMYSLLQFSSSWLSREIWFTATFVGLVVLAAIILIFKPEMKKVISVVVGLAAVVGLIDVFAMGSIYSTTSAPFWQGSATYFEFYAATISMGAVCFFLLSRGEIINEMTSFLGLAVIAVIIVQVAAVTNHLIVAGTSSQLGMQDSLAILVAMPVLNALKWILILIGTTIFIWLSKKEISTGSMKNLIVFSVGFIVVGQVIGRYLFYAAMVIPGIG